MAIDGSCHKKLKAGFICEECETEVGGEFDVLGSKPAKEEKKKPAKKK